LDKQDRKIVAKIKIPKGASWDVVDAKVSKLQTGIHNPVIVSKKNNPVEIERIHFAE